MKIFGIKNDEGHFVDILATTDIGVQAAFVNREWMGEYGLPLEAVKLIWREYHNRGYRVVRLEVFSEAGNDPIPEEAYDVLAEAAKIADQSDDITPDPNSL